MSPAFIRRQVRSDLHFEPGVGQETSSAISTNHPFAVSFLEIKGRPERSSMITCNAWLVMGSHTLLLIITRASRSLRIHQGYRV